MWINDETVIDSAITGYRESLVNSCPNHVVIDNLFIDTKLDAVIKVLQQPHYWKTQQHTYDALYVDSNQWLKASKDERFVQRDAWQDDGSNTHTDTDTDNSTDLNANSAQAFLSFLRGDEFMSILSRIFKVTITDMNVADPDINTNYFRLGAEDFVEQHADDSPGREICMLLYLNKDWHQGAGGELVFIGENDKSISIAPTYNRCVLFDPASKGSEHWVNTLNTGDEVIYRYNVTSWYWSE